MLKDFNDFFMYLFRWRKGGCTNACICSAFTIEPLDGCLRNLVGMKFSWPCTWVKAISPQVRIQGRTKIGHEGGFLFFKKLLLHTGRLKQQTECIASCTLCNFAVKKDIARLVMILLGCAWFHKYDSHVYWLANISTCNGSAHCTQVSNQGPLEL